MNAAFAALAVSATISASAMAGVQSTVINFDNGWEGFAGYGNSFIENSGGNPGNHAHTIHNNFGIEWWTQSNSAFVGDFSQYSSVTISIDVKVESIIFFGSQVTRNLILDMRSFSLGQNGYPYSSVWYNLGEMAAGPNWLTYSVTFDPNSQVMPAGWGGTGAEDPGTFEPILPKNLTFADVMQNVQELAFTTYEPGWFYGFTDFDIRVDNIRIDVVPIPAPAGLALLAIGGLRPMRRRRV
jgi:hypothetical protein